MAREIQTVPQGLLSALTLKGGQPPNGLEDTARMIVDGAPFWFDQALTLLNAGVAGTLNATAVGNTLNERVPGGARWLVYAIQGAVGPVTAAADRIRWHVNVLTPDGGNTTIWSPPEIQPTAIGDILTQGLLLPRPILLGPGFGLQFFVDRITAAVNIPCQLFPLGARFGA